MPEPGPGPGAGQDRRRRRLPLRPAPTGGARRSRGRHGCPSRSAMRTPGWVEKMGPGATGFHAGRPGDRVRPMGLRPVHELPPWDGELLPGTRRSEPGRARRPRRRHGRIPARPLDALPDPAGQPRSPRGRPAHRRGADQLPRREAVASPAGAGLNRGGDRGRRAGPDGHPGAARAVRGDNRCRGGHLGRQTRRSPRAGRRRGAALG